MFCVCTEVMAQDETVTFEKKHTLFSTFLPMSKVVQS